MGSQCTVCMSTRRPEIELGLASKTPVRTLARKFEVSKDSLYRHRRRHMPQQLLVALQRSLVPTEVDLEALRRNESESLLQSLVVARARLWSLADQAEGFGDIKAAVSAHAQITKNLDLTGKLLGELTSHSDCHEQHTDPVASVRRTESRIGAGIGQAPGCTKGRCRRLARLGG